MHNPPPNPNHEASTMPLVAHLVELRQRLLRMVLVILGLTLVLLPFANELYTWLSQPLLAHLPRDSSMIATEVASPFLAPFKLTLITALMLALPFVLYQLWAFVAPGLYRHERRLIFPLIFVTTALFFLGMAFAYTVVFPLIFGFFTQTAPEGVAVMTDIGRYLDFVLKLLFAFGLAFEVPVITWLLVWTGTVDTDRLRAQRPFVIVGAFVIGMLLTPPDVISQILLAMPIWCLFELGLWLSRWIPKRPEQNG